MADYIAAHITIGGRVPRRIVPELCEVIYRQRHRQVVIGSHRSRKSQDAPFLNPTHNSRSTTPRHNVGLALCERER